MNSLDRGALERFRALIAARLGLQFDNGKMDVLADVMQQRLARLGKSDAERYLTLLAANGEAREELRVLAEHLTVSETYFFRNPEHFRALTEVALPERLRARVTPRPLRILSAGCASGEEAYSLAILIREHFPGLSGSGVILLGLDINPAMLAKARSGRYGIWSLRQMPPEITQKYFRADGREFLLSAGILSMVAFEERNLAVEESSCRDSEEYDIIFCRNVIMYLVPEAARVAVARLTRMLAPAGYLFLSHAETLRGLSRDFHLRNTHDTFYYQKRQTAAEPAPLPVAAQPVPALEAIDSSWVEAVRRASEHIDSLSRRRGRCEGPAATEVPARGGSSGWPQIGLAFELMGRERFRDALDLLRVLPEAAVDRDVQLLQAVLLTNCGDTPKAQELCERLLSSDDLNAGAHYVAALCREHAGDPKGAWEHDRAAIYLDPGFAMPHLHLGLLAKRSGDMTVARRELEQATTLLLQEEAPRILLLGGGFSREALLEFSRAELCACGGRR